MLTRYGAHWTNTVWFRKQWFSKLLAGYYELSKLRQMSQLEYTAVELYTLIQHLRSIVHVLLHSECNQYSPCWVPELVQSMFRSWRKEDEYSQPWFIWFDWFQPILSRYRPPRSTSWAAITPRNLQKLVTYVGIHFEDHTQRVLRERLDRTIQGGKVINSAN